MIKVLSVWSFPRCRATREKSSGGIRLIGAKSFSIDLTKRSTSVASRSRQATTYSDVLAQRAVVSSFVSIFFTSNEFLVVAALWDPRVSARDSRQVKIMTLKRTSRQQWDLAVSVWPHPKVEIWIDCCRGTIPHRQRQRGTSSYRRKKCRSRRQLKRSHGLGQISRIQIYVEYIFEALRSFREVVQILLLPRGSSTESFEKPLTSCSAAATSLFGVTSVCQLQEPHGLEGVNLRFRKQLRFITTVYIASFQYRTALLTK